MKTPLVAAAISRFQQANAADPNRILVDGEPRPRELVQAERLAQWVERLAPDASTALQLAAHCQHLRRWEIPRSAFPDGRLGYLKWRKQLAKFHADAASSVLRELGADEGTIQSVRTINLKRGLGTNPEVQTMEDALCLSFLEHEAAEFAAKHTPEKVLEILSKTLAKMSPEAQRLALDIELAPELSELLRSAIAAAVHQT